VLKGDRDEGEKAVVSVGHRSQEPAISLGSLKKQLLLLPDHSLRKLSAEWDALIYW